MSIVAVIDLRQRKPSRPGCTRVTLTLTLTLTTTLTLSLSLSVSLTR